MRIKAFTDGACSLTIFSRRGKYDPERFVCLDIIDMQSALHQMCFLQSVNFFTNFELIENSMKSNFPSQFLKVSLNTSEIKYWIN